MESLLFECAVRAALVAAATAVVLRVLGIRTAAARHKTWTAVLFVMLLLPAWVAVGPRLRLEVLRGADAPAPMIAALTVPAVQQPPTDSAAAPSKASSPNAPTGMTSLRIVVQSTYLFGVMVMLLRLAYGTSQTRTLRRRAVMEDGHLTSAAFATPMAVGWFNPVVILPVGWQRWPQTQLHAVLTHEQAHVRRRDPAVQWLSLLNLSIFWFHPLAWWLKRRLAALAEEACDAKVLAAGHSPEDYSRYLLDLARDIMREGGRVRLVGHAMPGGDLAARIRRILGASEPPRASKVRLALAVSLVTGASVLFTAATPAARAAAAGASQAPSAFEVASIKVNNSGSGQMGLNAAPGGRLSATNVTLLQLITSAYDLQDFQVVGVPAWLAKQRFDIEAKGGAGSPDNIFTPQAGGGPSPGEVMLRALLADRFTLESHHETRELPIYALVRDRKDDGLGPQLKSSTRDCAAANKAEPAAGAKMAAITAARCEILAVPGAIVSGGIAMADLVAYLSPLMERVVIDRTGLAGNFEFMLRWTPDRFSPAFATRDVAMGLTPMDENGPSLSTALREQLGLKLDSQRGPVPVLVIDRVTGLIPN